jgi:hypothetical protein
VDIYEFTAKIGLVSDEADESVFWLERMATAGGCVNAPFDSHLTIED